MIKYLFTYFPQPETPIMTYTKVIFFLCFFVENRHQSSSFMHFICALLTNTCVVQIREEKQRISRLTRLVRSGSLTVSLRSFACFCRTDTVERKLIKNTAPTVPKFVAYRSTQENIHPFLQLFTWFKKVLCCSLNVIRLKYLHK